MIRHRHVKEVTHCNLIKAGEKWAGEAKTSVTFDLYL